MRRRITMRRELKGTDEEMNNDEEEVGGADTQVPGYRHAHESSNVFLFTRT